MIALETWYTVLHHVDPREKQEDIERIREELQAKGANLPPKKAKEAHFDSNCITPGQIGSAITIIYVSYKM